MERLEGDDTCMAALSLEDQVVVAQDQPFERDTHQHQHQCAGGGGADEVVGTTTTKKKKQKKKKKAAATKLGLLSDGDSAAGVHLLLPSQKLVEKNFPWTTVIRPRRGRCAIATRAIKAGEVVIAEQAVAFVPRSQDHTAVCHACCKDLGHNSVSFECAVCKHVVYCQECQAKALDNHSSWCAVSQQLNEIAKKSDCDGDLLRFVLALALRQPPRSEHSKKASEDEEDKIVGTVKEGVLYPTFQDALGLQTHQDKVSAAWKASVKKGCSLLLSTYESSSDNAGGANQHKKTSLHSSVEELQMLAMLVNTNAHGMGAQGLHNTDVALGIFPFVSMLNHSCWPNCCFASEGSVMYVRATQDIAKDSELCVSYINLYEPRGVRKQNLADTKHFDCSCPRCSEPLISSIDRFLELKQQQQQQHHHVILLADGAIPSRQVQGCLCTVRGCGGVLLKSSSLHAKNVKSEDNSLSSWECDLCSYVVDPHAPGPLFPGKTLTLDNKPWELVPAAENSFAAAMGVYRERRFKDARVLLERFLADFSGKLHPLHVLVFDALTPLMNCCRAMGDAAEGSRFCHIILDCLEKVIPGLSLELANFYFCLGEMYSERAEARSTSQVLAKRYRKQAQETFQRVRAIRETCLGKANLPPY